jgi:formylmethanofuran dehydrogenase subunit E
MGEIPRENIEKAIADDNLDFLLKRAAELHGHYCPPLAMGVKAGHFAMKTLGVESNGMEGIIAIIETNNCFSDGIQMVTGCTFGNNGLIYRDMGKMAVTVVRRGGDAVRMSVKPDFRERVFKRYPEATKLFEKRASGDKLSEEETKRMAGLFQKVAFDVLQMPLDEIVDIKKVSIELPPFAPIFDSAICEQCGESVMETRARVKKGRILCLECGNHPISYMDGHGIGVIVENQTN